MIDKKNITGIILAGGKSSRMGTEKGLLELNGSTFIAKIINAIEPLVNDILIISKNKKYDILGCKRINDLIENSGPVAGVYTGLYHSKTQLNLVLSCDIPLITPNIIKMLILGYENEFEVIQLQSQNKTMPLIAIYNKQCMHKCLDFLQQNERRLRSVVNQFKTKTILIDSKFDKFVKNINTNADLKSLNHATEN